MEIGSKEDILHLYLFEVFGHRLGRTLQVNVVVHHVRRILVFLAARGRMNGFPLVGIPGKVVTFIKIR